MSKALVVLSGGQDSTTCLFWALEKYDSVSALTFNYNQRHKIELESATKIAKLAGVPHRIVDMGPIFGGVSPLTNYDHEVEEYTDAESLPGGLENTFVPGRNILFLTVAGSQAYVDGADSIILGVSEEDFGGYPDCREDFIRKMEAALASGLDKPIKIETPLVHLNKKQTVELAQSLLGCMEALAFSHTCYNGAVPPCGTCHACLLRARGFAQAAVPDPLVERLKNETAA
ncbi:MAG: 7-cyano-7-deazaguanine synthase QueC [Proteobacteria bacterium]|nr:7-cyano-7-deazaguanine synthase QueC [Pseudomonadota bacterium]